MAKISIIVPVYNVEKYIADCLNSLIGQTITDIEIICVDDCGTDNSMKCVYDFAKKDSRIKVVKNKKNSGLSASRNHGMMYATAPYIMFCDSDDMFAPDMCEKLYNAITEQDADIGLCGTKVLYEADFDMESTDREYFAVRHTGTHDLTQDIQNVCSVCAWNKIYKRSIISEHDVLFPAGLKYEDEYFFKAYCLWVDKIAFVQEPLYLYRRRAGSIMNSTYRKKALNLDPIRIAIAFYNYASENNLIASRQDWFWGKIFHDLLWASLNYSGKRNEKKVYRFAQNFIGGNFMPDAVSSQTKEIIQNMTPYKPFRFLFGKIKRVNKIHKVYLDVFGLRVWCVKYSKNHKQIYLFGIKLANTLISDKAEFTNKLPSCKNSLKPDKNLVNELKSLGEFVYVPNPGNLGDMLIYSSTIQFFKKLKLKYSLYKAGDMPETVVYGGGGIWIDLYECSWLKFLDVFKNAKRIVILPSSFNNCAKLIEVLDERFVVFCRERQSFKYLTSQNTNAKILMAPDMALGLDVDRLPTRFNKTSAVLKYVPYVNNLDVPDVAYFTRQDMEKHYHCRSDLDVSGLGFGLESSSIDWADFCSVMMLQVINKANVIVTDRLHVAIAGYLLNKEVYLLDNTYGKLSAVYAYSLKQYKNMHFCPDLLPR